MMTHGWWKDKNGKCSPHSFAEFHKLYVKRTNHQRTNHGILGANVKKGPICVLAPKYNIIATTETDEKGQFIAIPHSETARHSLFRHAPRKGFAGVDILMDPPQYPVATHKAPYFNGATTFMEDYLMNIRDQYYMEGGMRVYNLKK